MSGWDTSSRPSWGQQDDPEDSTQNVPASDIPPKEFPGGSDGARSSSASPLTDQGWPARQPADQRESAGFPQESAFSGPPPEFFGQEFEKQEFQKREPGATLGNRDLPGRNGRGRH